jgi:hypothetical protein
LRITLIGFEQQKLPCILPARKSIMLERVDSVEICASKFNCKVVSLGRGKNYMIVGNPGARNWLIVESGFSDGRGPRPPY